MERADSRQMRRWLARRKREGWSCGDATPRPETPPLLHNRKGSRSSSVLDSDCLFPKEQGATGMNSSVLTASLTGRIQFFLRRCVATNRYFSPATADSMCCAPPYGSNCDLEATTHIRAVTLRGVNEGTSPAGARAPVTSRLLQRPLGGGPEGRAPMEVPDLRATLPNSRPRSPLRIPCHLGLADLIGPQPVSAACTKQSTCQARPDSERR